MYSRSLSCIRRKSLSAVAALGLVPLLCFVIAGCGAGVTTLQTSSNCADGGNGCQSSLAPTSTLLAEPASITSGQSTKLSWSSQNGTTLDLEPGIGPVPAQGTARINPRQTTTYTLTVKGSGGTSKASVTIKVVAQQSGSTSGSASGGKSGGTSGGTSSGTSGGTSGSTSGSTSSGTQQLAGIQLSPGDDIEAAVKANSTGTTFVLNPGVYRMQSVVPKDGDVFSGQSGATLVGAAIIDSSSWRSASSGVWEAQANGVTALASPRGVCDSQHPACMYPEDLFFDSKPLKRVASLSQVGPGSWYLDYSTEKVYVGSDPGGHTVELSEARAAFWGSASNVTIKGLAIEKYASIAGKGAINAMASLEGYGPVGAGWVVDSNNLFLNHGLGVRASDGMTISNNKIHDNGQMGLAGTGNNILVKGNEIYQNNYAGYSFDWEAGGAKIGSYSTHVTFDSNYVHDNKGPGLHGDIGCDYFVFQNNHTARNVAIGIHWEISYHAVIRNNLIEDDGFSPAGTTFWYGGGIVVSNSENVEVYGNTVKNCMNGIGGTQGDRGTNAKTGATYNLKNLYVHDNTIIQKTGRAEGIVKSSKLDNTVFTSWGNHFKDSAFTLAVSTYTYFCWLNQDWTLAQWLSYAAEH